MAMTQMKAKRRWAAPGVSGAALRLGAVAAAGALVLGAMGARAGAARARTGAANGVEGVDVAGSGPSRIVRIRTTQEPTFTVFRLSDPMRVVVDISGGDLSHLDAPISVDDGVVGEIATRQFNADGFLIGRVIVGFDHEVAYQVQAEGHSVVIRSGPAAQAAVESAAPPPVAPVDRAAAERFEAARRQAEQAAARAADERKRAEDAAAYAQKQQQEAERIAHEAERTRGQAEQARKDAERLRAQAKQSIERDRAKADAAARAAEERLRQLQETAQKVAQSRADAERVAAEAERARRDAEEAAARAEARHKQQVAELEEQVARAQKEKQAADAAWERARAAKKEAEAAQQTSAKAREAAEKTRAETAARLAEIADREKKAKLAIEQLAGQQRAVAQQLSEVNTQKREVEAQRQEVESHRAELTRQQAEVEAQRRKLEEERGALAAHRDEVDAKQKRVETQTRKLATMQRDLEQIQTHLAQERTRLDEAQRRVAAKSEQNARAKEQKSRDSARQQAELEAERRRLDEARRSVEHDQKQLDAQKQRLADAHEAIQREQQEQGSLDAQRADIEKQKHALEKKARGLAALEQRLSREHREAKATLEQRSSGQHREAKAAEPTPAAAGVSVESLVGKQQPQVVLASADPQARASARPRAKLTGVTRRGDGADAAVLLAMEGQPHWEVQQIEDPPRLIVDLADTDRGVRRLTYAVESPFVRRVRLGDHGSVLRVVLDLTADGLAEKIEPSTEGLLVRLHPRAPAPAAVASAPPAAAGSAQHAATPRGAVAVRDIRFTGTPEVARIIMDVDPSVTTRIDDRSSKSWLLALEGATLPRSLERSLDTSAYKSVVRLVSAYQAAGDPPTVNVVANLTGKATQRLEREDGKLVWDIYGSPRPPAVAAAAAAPQTAGYAAEAAVLARSTPRQARAAKKRISIDLKDADIINVIRLLAEVSGENIIATDDVKGKITLKLNNVPWDQALNTILKIGGYDMVREHNIMRIAPADKIRQEKELELATQRAQEQVEKTLIKMITVNYADANEIVAQVKPLLSGRGTVQVDTRTNTIILEDVRSNIDRVAELVQRLDKPTPQVLIEARIVEASSNSLQELGIQWGGVAQATETTGTATGLVFPGNITATGIAGDANATSAAQNYAVNLPAPIGQGAGGGIGLIFGSAGGSQLLNLRLSALENNGKGRIISAPRVTTLDNRKAKIAQGVDIPITVVSAAGANTRYIPANLELEVTPHVTNDGSILMKIKASKNEPNFTQTGAQGDPTIEKREAETEVLVRDNDTTVIGGIYTRNATETYAKVPLLGDLPILGWLFKSRRTEDRRAELLVFITPRIVNRAESMLHNQQLDTEKK